MNSLSVAVRDAKSPEKQAAARDCAPMRYPYPLRLSTAAGRELATSPHWGPTLRNDNHQEVEHAPSLEAS